MLSPRYAGAVLALLSHADAALGHPERLDLVDIGAGQGELLGQVLELAEHLPAGPGPARPGLSFPQRIVPRAVEIAPQPSGGDDRIRWSAALPDRIRGLVIASEWLDNIPVDVAELTPDGPRIMLVDPGSGAEQPGPPARPAERDWLRRWWPLQHPGDRAELGHPRCAAWAGVIGRLDGGLALAADYAHSRASRPRPGPWPGSGTAGRCGRSRTGPGTSPRTWPWTPARRPGPRPGPRRRCSPRSGPRCGRWGCPGGGRRSARPTVTRPGTWPRCARAAEAAELTDPAGLGGFGWLIQAVGVPLPGPLAGLGAG